MKRKATEELLADRLGLPHNLLFFKGKSLEEQHLTGHLFEGPETSLVADDDNDDDGSSQDIHTAHSEAHTTPVTTAISTASRRFPSDLKTISCTWPGCTKTFNRPARLTAHIRSHTNDRPFKCPDCSKTYLEEKHLRQHIKGSHSQERQYVCTECSKAFLTATRLRRHAAVHEGEDRFRCRGYNDNCTRTFRKHQTLQRHIRIDHLDQPAFACTHEVSVSSASSKMCDAVFDSQGALRRHIERDHTAPKYWCEECRNASGNVVGFATRVLLEAHMRHEHVDCPFCEVRCLGPAELHRHVDMHHSGKSVADRKNIACPYDGCGKLFTRRANLNVHIRAAHKGSRFVCGDADAASVTTSCTGDDAARAPLRSATDPALAAWEARGEGCGRGFVSKMKLEEHILYVHLGLERPAPAVVPLVVYNKDAALATGLPSTLLADGEFLPATSSTDDMIDALLGSNRTLMCSVAGCDARFVRNHDLNVHLRRDHAAPDKDGNDYGNDLQINDRNENLFNHDEFWIGGGDLLDDNGIASASVSALAAEEDIFRAYLDMENVGHGPYGQTGDLDMGLALHAASGLPPQMINGHAMMNDSEWQVDEAEMRQLIGSDGPIDSTNKSAYLDPNLFY